MIEAVDSKLIACAAALLFANAMSAQTPIDFSYAGYGGGGVAFPAVPAVLSVRPTGGDDTSLLNSAIDAVSLLPMRNGFRGALLLRPGRYRISGQVRIRTSGVVLSGVGNVTIVGAGTSRRTLIEVGAEEASGIGGPVSVIDDVAAGSVR